MAPLVADPSFPVTRTLPADGLIEVVRGVVSTGGSLWMQVTGISMNPLLREGDRVLLTAPTRELRRGDVVLIDAEGSPVLHRVRRLFDGMLVARGDAASTDDPPMPVSRCVARAVAARRGSVTVALVPTFRFGVKALLWFVLWRLRVRVPSSMSRRVKPLSRAITRALS